MQQVYADVDAFNAEIQAAGAWVFGGGLHPADTATVVTVDGRRRRDRPTARSPRRRSSSAASGSSRPTDLDAALAWAAKATVACRGPVEVRPFQDEPEA